MKDRVIFLVHPDNNEVLAYFKYTPWDRMGNRLSYAHIGQHGPCSPAYADECRQATKEEYSELLEEIKGMGYNPAVINEMP